jgi:hypothetical protein
MDAKLPFVGFSSTVINTEVLNFCYTFCCIAHNHTEKYFIYMNISDSLDDAFFSYFRQIFNSIIAGIVFPVNYFFLNRLSYYCSFLIQHRIHLPVKL